MEELHTSGNVSWPNDCRIAVALTFDFQGGEDVRPDRDGKMNHEEWTQAEYGPRTGIWRILRILEEEGVKATFLTCGAIAERYPEAVKAIAQKGHEVAGHGYHHEVARDFQKRKKRGHQENDRNDSQQRRETSHGLALVHSEPQQPGAAHAGM